MSLEYIAAGVVGLLFMLFLGFVALVGGLVLLAKLTGGRSPIGAPVDPAVETATRFVAVVDSGRIRGAAKLLDRLADHEAETFVSNVAAGVGPKSGPPAK